MKWKIVFSTPSSAETNMSQDFNLLASLASRKEPVLHFYNWEGECATFGYFTDPWKYLNREEVQNVQLDLAKRPTGGGILFHMTDLAFGIILPNGYPGIGLNTLENYAFINQKVANAIHRFRPLELELLSEIDCQADPNECNFCFAKPTKYDIALKGGGKIAGAAHRRTRHGLLHQGSIALSLPPFSWLERILLPGSPIATQMHQQTSLLLDTSFEIKDFELAKASLQELLIEEITKI